MNAFNAYGNFWSDPRRNDGYAFGNNLAARGLVDATTGRPREVSDDELLLDATLKKNELARQMRTKSELQNMQDQVSFLNSFSSLPVNKWNTGAAPTNEREAFLQNLLNNDRTMRDKGFEVGWKNDRRVETENITRLKDFLNIENSRAGLEQTNLENEGIIDSLESRYRQQALDQKAAQQAYRDNLLGLRQGDIQGKEFQEAIDFVINGENPQKVIKHFPNLTPEQRQRLNLYAKQFYDQTSQEFGNGMSRADRYNALLADARQKVANGGTGRQKKEEVQKVMDMLGKDRTSRDFIRYDENMRTFVPVARQPLPVSKNGAFPYTNVQRSNTAGNSVQLPRSAATGEPIVRNEQEFNSLPPGTVFYGPDGIKRKKP